MAGYNKRGRRDARRFGRKKGLSKSGLRRAMRGYRRRFNSRRHA